MIVVIASRHDETARALVAHWKAHDAHLLTCEDLSVAGWCYYPGTARSSIAVVGGQTVAAEEIKGILIRMPGIPEQELLWIVPADRPYVALEMTSFLISWLSEVKCPVLNRPTPLNLSGPSWRPEQWTYAAARVGIPVHPVCRRISLSQTVPLEAAQENPVTVTIVGDRGFGQVDAAVTAQARLLACAANVGLLSVQFSGPEIGSFFLGANIWPDVLAQDVADAVIAYFQERGID